MQDLQSIIRDTQQVLARFEAATGQQVNTAHACDGPDCSATAKPVLRRAAAAPSVTPPPGMSQHDTAAHPDRQTALDKRQIRLLNADSQSDHQATSQSKCTVNGTVDVVNGTEHPSSAQPDQSKHGEQQQHKQQQQHDKTAHTVSITQQPGGTSSELSAAQDAVVANDASQPGQAGSCHGDTATPKPLSAFEAAQLAFLEEQRNIRRVSMSGQLAACSTSAMLHSLCVRNRHVSVAIPLPVVCCAVPGYFCSCDALQTRSICLTTC